MGLQRILNVSILECVCGVGKFWNGCDVLGFSRETEPTGCIYGERKRFIIRDCLMWLWRLRSPKICAIHTGDPGEPMVWFQSESRGLRVMRADGRWFSPKADKLKTQEKLMFQFELTGTPKLAWKDWCLGSSTQTWGLPSYSREDQPFRSIWTLNWLVEGHPHYGGQSALLSLWCKC